MGRIAVIGSGISGMSAAYLLSRRHQVTLLERETRLGGHTHTHNIDTSAWPLPIDTGFIVHNDHTYPNLIRLLGKLGVERQLSDMSFSVACMKTGYEFSSRGLGGFFSQPRNFIRPRHYGLLLQIARFNREAPKVLDDPPEAPSRWVSGYASTASAGSSAATISIQWPRPCGPHRWKRLRSFRH